MRKGRRFISFTSRSLSEKGIHCKHTLALLVPKLTHGVWLTRYVPGLSTSCDYISTIDGSFCNVNKTKYYNNQIPVLYSHQRRCFHKMNLTLIAKYWLVPGTDSSVNLHSN